MSNRTIAKITGWSLVAMAVIAGFSLGYAYEEVFSSIQTENFQNAAEYFQLFRLVLLGLCLTIILDFIVSFTLYKFFKNDNRVISLISAILRVIYTLILVFASLSLISNWAIWGFLIGIATIVLILLCCFSKNPTKNMTSAEQILTCEIEHDNTPSVQYLDILDKLYIENTGR
jgi:hypothetical protein